MSAILNSISVTIPGIPAPQPRTKAYLRGTKVGVFTPGTANAWKKAVVENVLDTAAGSQFEETDALVLVADFYLPRPKNHYNTRRAVKPAAPRAHKGKPDLDNLLKSTMDAIVDSGLVPDDRQFISITAMKHWTEGEPGACLVIERREG